MSIKYDKFFKLLKAHGLSTYTIRKNKLLSESILQKLRHGTGKISGQENTIEIDTRTIEKLCKLLNCQPGDIMEYIDDE